MNQTPFFDQSNPEGAINPSSLRPDQIKGLCDVVAAIHDRSVGAKEEGETLCADWLLKLTSKALGLGPTELSTQLAAQSSTPGAVWQDTGENDGMRAPEQSDLGGGQTDVDPSQVKAPWSKQVLIDLCTVKTWIECHVSGKAPVSLITSDAALFVLKGAIEAVRGATRVANTAELKADPLWPTDGVYPDMAPPASQRDRWMFDQGRLAERRAMAGAAPARNMNTNVLEVLEAAERDLHACQAVLWQIERDNYGVDPEYGKRARATIERIKAVVQEFAPAASPGGAPDVNNPN